MKFQVGQYVICIDALGSRDLVEGQSYVISEVELTDDLVSVTSSLWRYSSSRFKLGTVDKLSNKKVYVSTPLKPAKFRLDQIQAQIKRAGVFAFIPTTAETTPAAAAAINKLQIELCDELWVFGPIGRDCSWEIGYAQGLKKPVKFFQTAENEHMVKEDWMLFCAGTEAVKSE
jgi:hypothetical protein